MGVKGGSGVRGVTGGVSWRAWLYIAAVVAAAAVIIGLRAGARASAAWWISLGALMLLFLVCDSTPTPLASRQSAWSPSSSATLAAVVLLGPTGAERVFNSAMYAVSGYAAGRAFVALGGHVGLPDPRYFPAIIAPFAAATAVHVLANHALVWGMLRLAGGSLRPRRQVEASALMLLVSDLCYASLGLVIAALWVVMGPLAPALALVPLFVARWA